MNFILYKNTRNAHTRTHTSTQEAGIGFTVLPKLKAGKDFIGRDALEAQRSTGLQRKLVCLALNDGGADDGARPIHGHETIWRDGDCIGYVRSSAFGHTVGTSVAYGYVDCPESEKKITNKWLKAGEWEIGDRGERRGATFHAQAVFDPTNERVKGIYE